MSACMKSPYCSEVAGHLPIYSSSSPRLSLTFAALTTLSRADCQFGWLQGIAKQLNGKYFWLARQSGVIAITSYKPTSRYLS